jgi:hypothetical protein
MFLDIVYCDAAKANNPALAKESILCLFAVNPDKTACHTPKTLNALIEAFSFFHFFLQGNTEIIFRRRPHPSKLAIHI